MTSNAERSDILARALRAGIEGDQATIREVCTEDVHTWTPAIATSTLTDLLAKLELRDQGFSDFSLEIFALDVLGEFACAEWSVSMTHSGPLEISGGRHIEPTGLRVTLNGASVAEFRGPRICSLRQYWDELGVYEQLGLVEEDKRVAGD